MCAQVNSKKRDDKTGLNAALFGQNLESKATITVNSDVVTWESSTDLCTFYRTSTASDWSVPPPPPPLAGTAVTAPDPNCPCCYPPPTASDKLLTEAATQLAQINQRKAGSGSADLKAGFIFGHFFGGSQDFAPRLDNVTDDPRYSRLLADFSSVGGNVILTVRFLEKRDFWLFGRPQPLKKPKKSKGRFFYETNNDIPSDDTGKICW